jgi:hypothetical protein
MKFIVHRFLSAILLIAAAGSCQAGLVAAEYYVGSDPGEGHATAVAFSSDDGLSRDLENAVIALNRPPGTYDVGLRVKDDAGRWSNAAIRRFTLVAGDFTFAGGIDPNAPDAGTGTGTSTPKLVEPLSQAEYYVGTDPGAGKGTAMTFASDDELSRDLESAVIALNMPAGTYDVGLRVKDDAGRWSNPSIRRFTLVAGNFTLAGGIDPNAPDSGIGTGTNSPKLVEPLLQAEYYVGTDPGTGNGTAMTFANDDELSRDLESAVVALNMPAGTYDVGLRVKDASGRWSNAAIRRFTLVAGDFALAGGIDPNAPDAGTGTGTSSPKLVEPLSQAEYYVGTDPGAGNGTAITFATDDELSRDLESAVIALNMPAGTYDVGLRVKDEVGRWSNAAIRRFTLIGGDYALADAGGSSGGTASPKLVQAEYFVGADPGAGYGTGLAFASDDGLSRDLANAAIALDSTLGTQSVCLRVKDDTGRWSNVAVRRFTTFDPKLLATTTEALPSGNGSVDEPAVAQVYRIQLQGDFHGGVVYSVTVDGHTVILEVRAYETQEMFLNRLVKAINADPTVSQSVMASRANDMGIGLTSLVAGFHPDSWVKVSDNLLNQVEIFGTVETAGRAIVAAEYFVDSPPVAGSGVVIPISGGSADMPEFAEQAVPIDTLRGGSHRVGVRFKNAAGQWGNVVYRGFTSYVLFGDQDITPPQLTLSGGTAIDWPFGKPFVDPGYTAEDEMDGTLTSQVVVDGTVNVNLPGIYTIQYRVNDLAGNLAVANRIVRILDTEVPTCSPFADLNFTLPPDPIDLFVGMQATDSQYGDLTSRIRLVSSNINWHAAGTYQAVFSVAAPTGQATNFTRMVTLSPQAVFRMPFDAWIAAKGDLVKADVAEMQPDADPDCDGSGNYEEWLAGTDSFDAGSRLVLKYARVAKQENLSWDAQQGVAYRVQASADLKTWQTLSDDLVLNTGNQLGWQKAMEAGTPKQFYRLSAESTQPFLPQP